MHCKQKFLDFIDSGDKESLKECITLIDIDMFHTKKISTLTDDCHALVKEVDKSKYYIHTHNITSIMEDIRKDDDENGTNWGENLEKCLDLSIRENTCNCVNIVLYAIMKSDNYNKLSSYLNNVMYSLKNIQINLPNWILRFYMDKSVLEFIQSALDSELYKEYGIIYYEILKYICYHEQSEIYILMCPTVINEQTNIAKTRHYRFLSMWDPEVNVSATREADGIVIGLDCHNLKFLENSQTFLYSNNDDLHFPHYNINDYMQIFMLSDKSEKLLISGTTIVKSYSYWLNTYKKLSEQYFFEKYGSDRRFIKKNNIIDVLAGLIATKCLFKKEYINEKLLFINEVYEYIAHIPDQNMDSMYIGFDEIFLNELFAEIIDNDMFNIRDSTTSSIIIYYKYAVYKTKYLGIVDSRIQFDLPNIINIDKFIDTYPINNEQLVKYSNIKSLIIIYMIMYNDNISEIIMDSEYIHKIKTLLFSQNIDYLKKLPDMYVSYRDSYNFANINAPTLLHKLDTSTLPHKIQLDTSSFDLLNELFEIELPLSSSLGVSSLAHGGNINYFYKKYLKYRYKNEQSNKQ
jgi:hypothetical protein